MLWAVGVVHISSMYAMTFSSTSYSCMQYIFSRVTLQNKSWLSSLFSIVKKSTYSVRYNHFFYNQKQKENPNNSLLINKWAGKTLAGSNRWKVLAETDPRVKLRGRERSSQLGSFAVLCCAAGVNNHAGWHRPGSNLGVEPRQTGRQVYDLYRRGHFIIY